MPNTWAIISDAADQWGTYPMVCGPGVGDTTGLVSGFEALTDDRWSVWDGGGIEGGGGVRDPLNPDCAPPGSKVNHPRRRNGRAGNPASLPAEARKPPLWRARFSPTPTARLSAKHQKLLPRRWRSAGPASATQARRCANASPASRREHGSQTDLLWLPEYLPCPPQFHPSQGPWPFYVPPLAFVGMWISAKKNATPLSTKLVRWASRCSRIWSPTMNGKSRLNPAEISHPRLDKFQSNLLAWHTAYVFLKL